MLNLEISQHDVHSGSQSSHSIWMYEFMYYIVYISPPLPLTLEYLAGGKARNLWDIFRAREISSPLRVFRASKRDGGGCSGCQTCRSKSKPRMTSTNSCLWPLRIPRNGILLLPWNFWRGASRAVKYHGSAPPQKNSQAKLGERKTYENACFSRFARTLPHQQVPVDA